MIKVSMLFKIAIIVMLNCLSVAISYAKTEQPITDQPIIETPVITSHAFNPNATCGDFLREFDPAAPDYFQYDSCDVNDKGQVRPIAAIYKIDGRYAKQAEQYVMNQFHTEALKFLCCYWTAGGWPAGHFINPKDNTRYTIGFHSEETLSSTDWQDLNFYLTIEVAREDT